jgi:gamma-butyrobetaine dioxygenase
MTSADRVSSDVAAESVEIDGARFHLIWLRDNCRCNLCQDAATLQKLFDITATDLTPRIRTLSFDDQSVHILWDEAPPHKTIYDRSWLRAHAYDRSFEPDKVPDRADVELWHGSRWRTSPPTLYEPEDSRWRDDVRRFGFALLGNIGEERFVTFLSGIGPIQPTEFGSVAPLRAHPDANDLGETGYALDPHTDYAVYMNFPPVLSFLHCIRNDSDGGVSILVDGFAAAEHFRKIDPEGFDLLIQMKFPFHQLYGRWGYHHRRDRPVIEVDGEGVVTGVYIGHPHTRNWRFPFDRMAQVYGAYSRFVRTMNDCSRQFHHRLEPGECLVFENERVMHGRTGFSVDSGLRHLQIAYVNRSYFEARRRFELEGSAELV